MKYTFHLLLLTLTLIACKDTTNTESSDPSNELNSTAIPSVPTEREETETTNSLDEQWDHLVFKQSVCLGGQQYMRKDQQLESGAREWFFNRAAWKTFAKNDTAAITTLLLTKLSDTTTTQVHTCPFFAATNGEIAVYVLQHLHQKNWFDFADFQNFKDKPYESATEQPQIWLQRLLVSEDERKKLAASFRAELK